MDGWRETKKLYKREKKKCNCNYVKEVHDASLYDITKPWCNVVSHSKPFSLCNVKLAVEHSTSQIVAWWFANLQANEGWMEMVKENRKIMVQALYIYRCSDIIFQWMAGREVVQWGNDTVIRQFPSSQRQIALNKESVLGMLSCFAVSLLTPPSLTVLSAHS